MDFGMALIALKRGAIMIRTAICVIIGTILGNVLYELFRDRKGRK